MTEKQILSRIIQKHDIETNWNKAANFVPMRGELIVYDIDANYDYERLKIGDGATSVVDLPFTGGIADWNAAEGELGYIKNRPFYAGESVDIEICDINAMATASGTAWSVVVDGIMGLDGNDGGFLFDGTIEIGKEYTISVNGTKYAYVAEDGAKYGGEDGLVILGDFDAYMNEDIANLKALASFMCGEKIDSAYAGKTFIMMVMAQGNVAPTEFRILDKQQEIVKLDPVYLPDETDPTVPDWAKAETKPAYTATEVGAMPEIETGTVGHFVRVKTVDENGKPTEYESAEIDITIDSELNAESENPVQNKVVNEAISNLNIVINDVSTLANNTAELVGDTAVSEQINNAIAEIPEQVQSDWSINDEDDKAYVKNRTHYVISETIEDMTIVFNGDRTGYESVGFEDINGSFTGYVKISNDIPEKSAFVGKEATIYINEQGTEKEQKITIDTISDYGKEIYSYGGGFVSGKGYGIDSFFTVVQEPIVYAATRDGINYEYLELSTGIWIPYAYLSDATNTYIIWLTSLNYSMTRKETQELDDVFIPDTIARTGGISWHQVNNRPFFEEVVYDDDAWTNSMDKTIEFALQDNGLYRSGAVSGGSRIGGTDLNRVVIWDGVTYHTVTKALEDGTLYFGNAWIIDSTQVNTGEPFYIVRAETHNAIEPLVYIYTKKTDATHVITIGNYDKNTYVKQLDEKFIPDSIARIDDIVAPKNELILNSSTSGSTKKFKITIDDDGILTATEIVESTA